MSGCLTAVVTIQSCPGDSENRRNEGAFSPEGPLAPWERKGLNAATGGSGFFAPFVKALENKQSSEMTLPALKAKLDPQFRFTACLRAELPLWRFGSRRKGSLIHGYGAD
jgi:hypothetical protein